MSEFSQRIWQLSQEKRRFVDTLKTTDSWGKVAFQGMIVTLMGGFSEAGKCRLTGYYYSGQAPVELAYLESWVTLTEGKELARCEQIGAREIENFLRDSNHLEAHPADPKYAELVEQLVRATAMLWWQSLWHRPAENESRPAPLSQLAGESPKYVDRILICQAVIQYLARKLQWMGLSKIQLVNLQEDRLIYDFESPEKICQSARETFPFFLHEVLREQLLAPTPLCVAE